MDRLILIWLISHLIKEWVLVIFPRCSHGTHFPVGSRGSGSLMQNNLRDTQITLSRQIKKQIWATFFMKTHRKKSHGMKTSQGYDSSSHEKWDYILVLFQPVWHLDDRGWLAFIYPSDNTLHYTLKESFPLKCIGWI